MCAHTKAIREWGVQVPGGQHSGHRVGSVQISWWQCDCGHTREMPAGDQTREVGVQIIQGLTGHCEGY